MTNIEAGQGPPGHDEGRPPAGKRPYSSIHDTAIVPTSTAGRTEWAPPPVPTVESYYADLGPVPQTTSCASCKYAAAFDDGGRRCRRHRTRHDVAVIAELDTRGRNIGLPRGGSFQIDDRVWPVGPRNHIPSRRALCDWAEANELRYADRNHAACESWVRGARCPGVGRCPGLSRAIFGRYDHASAWTGPGGLRLIVAQPYAVDPQGAGKLSALAAVEGLHVTVQPPGTSWYPSSAVYMVLIAGFPAAEVAVA